MLVEVTRVARSLDAAGALGCFAKHVLHTNSAGVEHLALERSTCFAAELQRCAVVMHHALVQLPEQLASVAAHIEDEHLAIGVRLGLSALAREILQHQAFVDPEPVTLLEPALTLEILLFHLEPWLPSTLSSSVSEFELDILRLGVAGDRLPAITARLVSAWRRFHRLRRLAPEVLRPGECPASIADGRLVRLGHHPSLRAVSPPATPCWSRRAREPDAAVPRHVMRSSSVEMFR